MDKHSVSPAGELSYYGLSLLSYLNDCHPLLAADAEFIAARADNAAEVYSSAIKSGQSHPQAEAAADEELYRGLHFSPYNTLVNIIWDEFAVAVPEVQAPTLARIILPLCGNILAKYSLADDFADTPQYELLYTELTGTVQTILEHGGVQ